MLFGGDGFDLLKSGTQNDLLFGEAGSLDTLDGGPGANTLSGGDGFDLPAASPPPSGSPSTSTARPATMAPTARATPFARGANERDFRGLMAVPHGDAVAIVAALRPYDVVDLALHQLVQHPEPDTDAKCQQAFPRRSG